jgi:glycosyltransferase involved in cell wall biosynthesis
MIIPSLSIVIPVYNSELSLPILAERLNSLLPSLAGQYEAVLVNDGSRDRSAEVMDLLAQQYSWFRPVQLMRNYGQHNALLCGIRQARYEIIVTMDDDLQNPPEEIEKLLRKLGEGYDAVYGYPEHESHGFLRDLASRITKISLQKTMGVQTANRVSSFRAFRTQIRDAFSGYRGAFVSIDVLLGWGTTRFAAIPVPNPPRTLGVSNYTVSKLFSHAVNMMTGFSTLPLQMASILGFSFALFGLLVLIYVVGRYLIEGGSVPGFPFLASIFSIFSGAQLFALGIIGEYLARMHFRLMEKPSYAIRSVKSNEY